ncbi:MAG: DUF4412 domain-containing protein [Polyangiaceae bacterium]|jgi:hypothetical protein
MRKNSFVAALAAPLALVTLAACSSKGFGANFEGEITMTTTHPNAAATTMVVKAKGDKLRVEMPAPNGQTTSAIYLPMENKMTLLLDAQKMAMDMDFGAPGAPQPNTNAQTSATGKTGKKELVAGISCEDWVVNDPSGARTETCIADGPPSLDLDALRHKKKVDPSAKRTFPMRSVEFSKDGAELSRSEVTAVKREKLDDSMFEVPAGYTHMPARIPGGGGRVTP